MLKPFALKLTKDIEDAHDLIQETLMKAFSNREKFTEGTNFKAWLYTIMKNTYITNYQRMVRRNTFLDSTDNFHYINSSVNSINNYAFTEFALEDIFYAINGLEDTYKVPFMMYYKGFKYYEIADKLEIPIGTVKNRIHIARQKLKKTLNMYSN